MDYKLGLFRNVIHITKKIGRRGLYTDRIYPYPHQAVAKLHPKLLMYRETWKQTWWSERDNRWGLYTMRVFWTYMWYSAFTHPEAFVGHFPSNIDPTSWTDEELGIPPLEAGSYKEWYKANRIDVQPDDN